MLRIMQPLVLINTVCELTYITIKDSRIKITPEVTYNQHTWTQFWDRDMFTGLSNPILLLHFHPRVGVYL